MGVVEENNHSIDYFNLSLNVPEWWTIASEEEKALLLQAGQEVIAENNEKLAEKMDLAKEKTLNLLFTFQHPLSYVDGINPNVICVAENLGLLGSVVVKTGKDYLDISKSSLEQTGLGYTFKEYTTETLGGKNFDVMETGIDLGILVITQKYYVMLMDGYALVFVNTYSTEDEANENQIMLNSVKF